MLNNHFTQYISTNKPKNTKFQFISDYSAYSELRQCRAKIRRIGLSLLGNEKYLNYEQFL